MTFAFAVTPKPDAGALVRDDRAASALYTDPALFAAEMSRIFENTWVWVAHASEIAKAGDFKTAQVGLHPVIVVRDRKGTVHVHVNRCRHRAATLCEVRKGKTSSFVCPYHGWAYALDGSLRGVPYEKGYDDSLNKADFPLLSLRVEEYHGLIFATFSREIQSLSDFLGPAKTWIDLFMKQGAGFPIKTMASTSSASPATGRSSSRTPPMPITSRSSTSRSCRPPTGRPRFRGTS